MNIKSLLIASTALFVGAASAYAADAIVYEEPTPIIDPVPVFSWEGAYIGGQVGYGWGRSDYNNEGYTFRLKPDGFLGGLYAGYNFDVGNNLVLGVEGDITYSDMDDGFSGVDVEDDEIYSYSSKLRWSGAVRARLGVAMDRWMPYIAGGVAFGKVKNSLWLEEDDGIYSASRSKSFTGWTAGAGVEYAATDNLLLRLEYRYTDFGKKTFYNLREETGLHPRTKFKTHDIRLGVAYKF